jgi:hypothetical protein
MNPVNIEQRAARMAATSGLHWRVLSDDAKEHYRRLAREKVAALEAMQQEPELPRMPPINLSR